MKNSLAHHDYDYDIDYYDYVIEAPLPNTNFKSRRSRMAILCKTLAFAYKKKKKIHLVRLIKISKNILTAVGILGMFFMICQVGRIDNNIDGGFASFMFALIGLAIAASSYLACMGINIYFGIKEVVYHDLHVWFDLMHKQDRDTFWAQLDADERHAWNRELKSEIARRKRVHYFQNDCGVESESIVYIYRYGDDN